MVEDEGATDYEYSRPEDSRELDGLAEERINPDLKYILTDSKFPPLHTRVAFNTMKIFWNVPPYLSIVRLGVGGKRKKNTVLKPGFKFLFSFRGFCGSYMFVDNREMTLDLCPHKFL